MRGLSMFVHISGDKHEEREVKMKAEIKEGGLCRAGSCFYMKEVYRLQE